MKVPGAAAIEMLSSPIHSRSLRFSISHLDAASFSSKISTCYAFSFGNLDYPRLSTCTSTATIVRSFSPAIHSCSSSSGIAATMASEFKPEEARVPPTIPPPTPPVTKFKIALCQLLVTADKERNIAHARQVIEEAARMGAILILLPEIWNSPYSNGSFPVYAEDIEDGGEASPSTAMLAELSRRLQITIVGGSIPERRGDKLYNTCCVFGTDGKLKAKHRKIHLFDIDIPGKMTFKESRTLTAGETPTIVDTGYALYLLSLHIMWDVPSFIISDLSPLVSHQMFSPCQQSVDFSNQNHRQIFYFHTDASMMLGELVLVYAMTSGSKELAAIYAARGAHLLCYPGAFNMTTGPLHWELLQRARAADCQLFVATCSPARDCGSSYVAWGHSTLVGPFGEVIATTEHDEAIVISEIDYSLIDQRRISLPFQSQRRGDVYQLVDVQRLHSTWMNNELVG